MPVALCSHVLQELGRLCRYPTATGSLESPPLQFKVSQQDWQTDHESCLEALKKALLYMYGEGDYKLQAVSTAFATI